MTDQDDFFAVLSTCGKYWTGGDWTPDRHRARRWEGSAHGLIQCADAAEALRVRGVACSVVHVYPAGSAEGTFGRG